MTRHLPLPALRRREGVSPWQAVAALALTLLVPGPVWASTPPGGCGRADLIGLATRADLAADGAVTLSLQLTDAPIASVTVRPVVLADGVLRFDAGPLRLPCGREVAWTSPPAGAAHAVHWTAFPWPPVPPALAPLTFDEAALRYGHDPPGLYPWADVELLRPAFARPAARTAPLRGHPAPVGELVDDRVDALDGIGMPMDGRLVRAPVGSTLAFRLRYAPGSWGGGPVIATCLLDELQLEAFDGRVWRDAEAAAGEVLEVDGTVTLPGPGWHRLHCLLLPDDPGERPATWPRPLLALYLWGDP